MKRHEARTEAISILYECEMSEENIDAVLAKRLLAGVENDDFTVRLAKGVIENQQAIDDSIVKYAKEWKVERMPYVDRNILRLSMYEVMFCADIPASVSIDEAVENAKKFGGKDSAKFINGVLGEMIKHNRIDEKGMS